MTVIPSHGATPAPRSYAWVVVGVSATVNSLAWSVRSTFALFYVALLGEFGWRRGEAALGYSLSWLLLLVFSPLFGRLSDRWGARLVVPIGGGLLAAALVLTGQANTLWQYYASFGVLGAAGIAAIQTPAAALVNRWFLQSRGAALGVVAAGASASAIVFYPLNAWLIVTFGWRTALVIFGVLVGLVTVPLAALVYRDPPASIDSDRGARAPRVEATTDEWTFGTALRSVAFWAVFVMWGLGVVGYQIVTTHQVAHAVDHGFSPVTVGWVFSLGGACTVAGNLLGGALSDRWGREKVFALGSLIGIAGIAALALLGGPHDLALLVLYAVSGVGFGMRIALLAAIPGDIFRGRHFGAILGAAHGGGGVGGFIGPFLAGWLFDVTGNYQLAFLTAAASIGAAAVAAWIAVVRGRSGPPRAMRHEGSF
jgi:MFS family permease